MFAGRLAGLLGGRLQRFDFRPERRYRLILAQPGRQFGQPRLPRAAFPVAHRRFEMGELSFVVSQPALLIVALQLQLRPALHRRAQGFVLVIECLLPRQALGVARPQRVALGLHLL